MNLQYIYCGGLLCLKLWRFYAIFSLLVLPAELGSQLFQSQYLSSEWTSFVKTCWRQFKGLLIQKSMFRFANWRMLSGSSRDCVVYSGWILGENSGSYYISVTSPGRGFWTCRDWRGSRPAHCSHRLPAPTGKRRREDKKWEPNLNKLVCVN